MESPATTSGARGTWEALIPLALLAFRCALGGRQPLYLDWMVILAVYWILYTCLSRSRAMPAITAATMTALFAIYFSRSFGQVLDALNLCR